MLSKSVERAQRKVEEWNFQGRKNLLEYDEIMEHQRRAFYGLRQRVLEGRDVKGLIFDYIEQSTRTSCDDFLDKGYAAKCAAEFARQSIDVPIEPDRLKGMDLQDMDKRIRSDAKEEVRQQISVTMGEYMPSEGSEFAMDFDAEGLARWAKGHFGVELDPEQLRRDGAAIRMQVEDRLAEAAAERIQSANLDGLAQFVEKDFGAKELSKWCARKYGFTIPAEQITKAELLGREEVVKLFLDKSRELYAKREIEYPVDFAMEMTMSLMRQSPQGAAQQLVAWANQRLGMAWTVEQLTRTPPNKCREELLAASKRYVESDELSRTVDEALALKDHDARITFFRDRLKVEWPDANRRLVGEDLENAIVAKTESVLRAELLYFERTLLLETLDPAWKDHLYAMDQLRDSIGFRAFSQRDPKIEYKREGSALFQQMIDGVRDKVSDFVFKARISPQFSPPQPSPAAAPPRQAQSAGPASSAGLYTPPSGGAGVIAGPGIDTVVTAAPPANAAIPAAGAIAAAAASTPVMTDRQQRDLDAAQRAGSASAEQAKAAPVVKSEKRYGRNDSCPQDSGRKYKKCCNRPDGTCTGQGLSSPPPPDDEE
jgi:preprotein translocase subunit SecA